MSEKKWFKPNTTLLEAVVLILSLILCPVAIVAQIAIVNIDIESKLFDSRLGLSFGAACLAITFFTIVALFVLYPVYKKFKETQK